MCLTQSVKSGLQLAIMNSDAAGIFDLGDEAQGGSVGLVTKIQDRVAARFGAQSPPRKQEV